MQTQTSLIQNDEIRTKEEREAEADICFFASRKMFERKKDPVFEGDRMRVCCIREDGHGHTCGVFRLKPFEKCPGYLDYLAHMMKQKTVSKEM